MKVKFCGAATSVTGSCHMISANGKKLLLDCGQFQGSGAEEAQNFDSFPFDPTEIEFVLLSHAHIDHCGRLPLLVKRGFTGEIYCTDATADLLQVMLMDSAHIHEKETEWKNRKAERAGRPLVEPLYTMKDAENALKLVVPVLYDELYSPRENVKFVFNDAGHILGSAITELWIDEEGDVSKLVFTGDLGVSERPILRNPTIIKKADHVIIESTYGNRVHEKNAMSVEKLADIVLKTTERGGTVVIPSFAVGRTQELIYEFNNLYHNDEDYHKRMGNLKVYIDSPMAISATEVFRKNAQVFDDRMKEIILKGKDPLDFVNLVFTRTTSQSMSLNEDSEPKVIISASGMCEAGRIRHHLKHHLWDPKSSVIFVGYQAEGTLGRRILDGAKTVTLFGEEIYVNAEIHNLEGFSGHADRNGLMNWLEGLRVKPENLFLVHGEEQSKKDFAYFIKEHLGYDAVVVDSISEFDLTKGERTSKEDALKELGSQEELEEIRHRLSKVHDDLETLLYNTHLAVGEEIDPEKIAEINNKVLSLEKDAINLGSTITDNTSDIGK